MMILKKMKTPRKMNSQIYVNLPKIHPMLCQKSFKMKSYSPKWM